MAIKLFFFDNEGTLTSREKVDRIDGYGNSLWSALTEALGPQALAEDDEGIRKWDRGEFKSYLDWCDYCVRTLQKYGLTRERFTSILNEMTVTEGADEVFTALRAKGIRTAIISGGFIAHAEILQQRFKTNHAYAACNLFWDKEGKLEHWGLLPSDLHGKVDFVELIRREYGFTKEECAFVGDGRNDVQIAAHVGLSFAYRAHPDLQKAATHSITEFREILRYLD